MHSGDWRAARIHQRSGDFSQRLITLPVDFKPARTRFEGLALEPDSLILSALKQGERADCVILRFFETTGERCRARLRLPVSVRSAHRVNLLEDVEEAVRIRKNTIELDVGPFEIVSLKLK